MRLTSITDVARIVLSAGRASARGSELCGVLEWTDPPELGHDSDVVYEDLLMEVTATRSCPISDSTRYERCSATPNHGQARP